MHRRSLLALAGAACAAPRAFANHGWSIYDTARPLYIEGPVTTILWADPHPHLELLHRPGYALPADLAHRRMPAQREAADLEGMLRAATVPLTPEGHWRVELPELNRLVAWDVKRPRIDTRLGVLGYPGPPVTGTPTLRAEVLFIGDRAYPLRSSPP
ncbi:DUF6152 family protein [Ramlibacter rhizophilus]|uniref:Uncharacterized protein n=1 Tax=Ramlibacter rhizophilus TaxID=1781167 RepID=A0A4Z0BKM0_9BURK|nr:DUF6152 family protein [Ramlibacter rhizophilus]TFY99865.1 hypothetical protein EZ242_12075 [Ramlibacter rhizophilus]